MVLNEMHNLMNIGLTIKAMTKLGITKNQYVIGDTGRVSMNQALSLIDNPVELPASFDTVTSVSLKSNKTVNLEGFPIHVKGTISCVLEQNDPKSLFGSGFKQAQHVLVSKLAHYNFSDIHKTSLRHATVDEVKVFNSSPHRLISNILGFKMCPGIRILHLDRYNGTNLMLSFNLNDYSDVHDFQDHLIDIGHPELARI